MSFELPERDRAAGVERVRQRLAAREQQEIVDGIVVCRDCGDPIDPRRLARLPNAARCTECQGYVERAEAQYAE